MHTLLSTLFAIVFSFSHAASIKQASAAPLSSTVVAVTEHVPSRLEIARLPSGPSYAGSACVSCRRTNVTYRVR